MTNDPLADALNTIKTHKMVGQNECMIKPASKLIREMLNLFQANNYIGEFEYVDNGKSGYFMLKELGAINSCGVIKPRFNVKASEWAKWEQRFIPSRGFGLLVVSTSQGIVTNVEAKKRGIGGRLLAFIY